MHRIDAPGATIGNLFTEGNPALSIPATEVSDDWLNDVQEELANFIESRGITLVKGLQTQLTDAINSAISGGGGQFKQALANSTGPVDVIGVILDKADFKGAQINYDIHRRSDTQNENEVGTVFMTHNTETDTWNAPDSSHGDDSGISWSVTATGQLQITTDNLTGTNYSGTLRMTGFTKFDD